MGGVREGGEFEGVRAVGVGMGGRFLESIATFRQQICLFSLSCQVVCIDDNSKRSCVYCKKLQLNLCYNHSCFS